MKLPHFLQLSDYGGEQLRALVERAGELKTLHRNGEHPQSLAAKHVVMLFSKPSTRTRLSFEVGIRQMGGHAIFFPREQLQLGHGESPGDTARVLSTMADAIVARETDHQVLTELRDHATVPVINALSAQAHPCQLLADMQTYREHRGDIEGRIVTWLGDGNNMCRTYIEASQLFGFQLRVSTPAGAEPSVPLPESASLVSDPGDAVRGAHLVVTDTWQSMGQKSMTAAEKRRRRKLFMRYQLNRELLALAAEDAVYMHCLPAYRGEEISAELMDNPDTLIWDEAENRLHAQKSLLEFIFSTPHGPQAS